MINTSSTAYPITLDIKGSFIPKSAIVKQIAPSSLTAQNTLSNPNYIKMEQNNVQLQEQQINVTIPQYSTVIIIVSQNEIIGIDSQINDKKEYKLYHNYPNPFNSYTIIRYDLPKNEHVNLRIFDVQGRVVSVLVDAEQTAGSHSVQWDGKNSTGKHTSSGLYFYELTTPSTKIVKKLIFAQ